LFQSRLERGKAAAASPLHNALGLEFGRVEVSSQARPRILVPLPFDRDEWQQSDNAINGSITHKKPSNTISNYYVLIADLNVFMCARRNSPLWDLLLHTLTPCPTVGASTAEALVNLSNNIERYSAKRKS
jgi:hypothetical protein